MRNALLSIVALTLIGCDQGSDAPRPPADGGAKTDAPKSEQGSSADAVIVRNNDTPRKNRPMAGELFTDYPDATDPAILEALKHKGIAGGPDYKTIAIRKLNKTGGTQPVEKDPKPTIETPKPKPVIPKPEKSADEWIAQLKDADPQKRSQAAFALGRLGEAARPALPTLKSLLRDRDENVRTAAMFALGKLGG